MNSNMAQVIVIGAGAAGLMAAYAAAVGGKSVTILEKNAMPGKKLFITGKGRCNVTNIASRDVFFDNIPVNPRFLYGAYARFNNQDVMDFFENAGVALKVERGGRIFPQSDKALDIIDALRRKAQEAGVKMLLEASCHGLVVKDGRICGVKTSQGVIACERVIVATGGKSYPSTGSTGDGYAFASACGHTITNIRASLVPMETKENFAQALQGLTLKNIGFHIEDENGKVIYRDFGELLFTHYGLSGPVVLSASCHMKDAGEREYTAVIDLKPALTVEQLECRILKDFAMYSNKDYINALDKLLPKSLIEVIVNLSGIAPHKKVNQITKEERAKLTQLLKHFTVHIKALRPVEEAVITSGGICVKEINPSTMESKLVNGLYFAGEIIDTEGYTGGFNLQIAFSTGYLAGISCADL